MMTPRTKAHEMNETPDVENVVEEARKVVVDTTHKIFQVGIGAVALAQDEANDLVTKLVDRGATAEEENRARFKEFVERRKKGNLEPEVVELEEDLATEEDEEKGNPFLNMTRNVLLASVGAVTLAQDEAEKFVSKLVERGQVAEEDGRGMLRDLKERRQKSAQKAEEELENRMENILDRMNIPSKADIDALSTKITTLTRKVDKLMKASSE